MNALDFLRQYSNCTAKVQILNSQIRQLELDDMGIYHSPFLSDMPKGKGPGDPVGQLAAAKADYAIALQQLKMSLLEMQRDIVSVLMEVGAPESQILAYRYLDGLSWDDIAAKVGYSRSQVHAYKKQGFEEVERVLKDRTLSDTIGRRHVV